MLDLLLILWLTPVLMAFSALPADVRPLLACGLVLLYWLPWYIAYTRAHHQVVAITLLTLFLGWTGFGWIIALIWSCSHIPRALPPPRWHW